MDKKVSRTIKLYLDGKQIDGTTRHRLKGGEGWLQYHMGHEDLKTTTIYANSTLDEVKASHDKFIWPMAYGELIGMGDIVTNPFQIHISYL